MIESAVQMRYRQFVRQTGREESSDSVREFLHLDMYINRGIKYDLCAARNRLQSPHLTHDAFVKRLCEKVDKLDIVKRIHQVHLPTESERQAFTDPQARIANIKRMLPIST